MWWANGNYLSGVEGKMMSLSEEWAALSRAMYGEEFIDELASLLKKNKVKTILECGCGDGYILNGLAKRGFKGLGIDSSIHMIWKSESNEHENIKFKRLSWLKLDKINENYDSVICRGNSLSYIKSWREFDLGPYSLNPKRVRKAIMKSLELMFSKLNDNGLLYLDTVSKSEINKGNQDLKIEFPEIKLKTRIFYDWQNKTRTTKGRGYIDGDIFNGGACSYLLTPDELEGMVRSFDPSKVWCPKLKHEPNYHIVCAKK